MKEIVSFLIGKVADVLPDFLFRIVFPPAKLASKVELRLLGEAPIRVTSGTDVPRLTIRFEITNLNPVDLVMDRLVMDLWFGQPTVYGAILTRHPVKASQTIKDVGFSTDLSEAQLNQTHPFLTTDPPVGGIHLYVSAYFASRTAMFEVQRTFERRKL